MHLLHLPGNWQVLGNEGESRPNQNQTHFQRTSHHLSYTLEFSRKIPINPNHICVSLEPPLYHSDKFQAEILFKNKIKLNSKKTPSISWKCNTHFAYLTVMAPQIEVDSLRGVPVPPAMAGSKSDAYNSSAIACRQPAFLIVSPPAHRFLLLAFGDSAFPGEAEDVGIAAKNRPMFHCCIHAF